MKLPKELIDKILINLNDLNIAFELSSYATKKIYENSDHPIDLACRYGNLELVKYIHNIGIKYIYKALNIASRLGYLDIIKYLYGEILQGNFEFESQHWMSDAPMSYYIKHNLIDAYVNAIKNDKSEIVKFFNKRLIYDDRYNYYACKYGSLNVVKCFYESNIVFSTSEMKIANDYGHIEVVKYLYKNGVKPTNKFMTKPASYGNLNMIKYLHSIGVKPNDKAMIAASKWGHIDVVTYFYSIGFKFCNKEFSCNKIMESEHKKIIEYHVSKTLELSSNQLALNLI